MAVLEQLIEGYGRSVPGTSGNRTVHGGQWAFRVPLIREGTGTIDTSPSGIGSGGSGAFVGAGRRSLALSERSELASDGRATEKVSHGAFVGGVRSER